MGEEGGREVQNCGDLKLEPSRLSHFGHLTLYLLALWAKRLKWASVNLLGGKPYRAFRKTVLL
jgi:hypothetical protein